MRILLTFILACVVLAGANLVVAAEATKEVVLISEVKWDHLNPKRGDLAPKAGTLWGDRNGNEPTGFLLRPPESFQSPPHIHNISYRGVVIQGVIHNDDPDAANMWMPAGSFWTQPKGEVHITSAKDKDSLAYIEVEAGPYLVLPKEEAFDSGERPVNMDRSNIVWLDAKDITWVDMNKGVSNTGKSPKIAYLWGDTQEGKLNGTFLMLPSGFTGKIKSNGSDFKAVVIQGLPKYTLNEADVKVLEPGSYFSSKGASAEHTISSKAEVATVIYIRSNGKYTVISE